MLEIGLFSRDTRFLIPVTKVASLQPTEVSPSLILMKWGESKSSTKIDSIFISRICGLSS